MGQRKYPPLTPDEIVAILLARGFRLDRKKGDHKYFTRFINGREYLVIVDMGTPQVSNHWLKLTIDESGISRDDFYCTINTTASKIGKKCISNEELAKWRLSVNTKGETAN